MDSVSLRPFRAKDRAWLIERHSILYAAEEGFDDSFGPFVAGIIDTFIAERDARCERGWIAETGTRRLGSIFCTKVSPETARLKMFLLEPEARGTGLGRKMLETCMSFAKARNYREMILYTHESHRAACALYRGFGWTLQSSKPVHSFGRDLVEQWWQYRF